MLLFEPLGPISDHYSHIFSLSIPNLKKLNKPNQSSHGSNVQCWRDCGTGRLDHGRPLYHIEFFWWKQMIDISLIVLYSHQEEFEINHATSWMNFFFNLRKVAIFIHKFDSMSRASFIVGSCKSSISFSSSSSCNWTQRKVHWNFHIQERSKVL